MTTGGRRPSWCRKPYPHRHRRTRRFRRRRRQDRTPDHSLLAVLTVDRENFEDAEDAEDASSYEAMVEFGSEFRVVPVGVGQIHANLELGNTGSEEYAEAARDAPDGVLNWWQD